MQHRGIVKSPILCNSLRKSERAGLYWAGASSSQASWRCCPRTTNVRQRCRALALQYALGCGGLRALTRPALIRCSEARCELQRNSRGGQISAASNRTVLVAMHLGNQDRQEEEFDSCLVWPARF